MANLLEAVTEPAQAPRHGFQLAGTRSPPDGMALRSCELVARQSRGLTSCSASISKGASCSRSCLGSTSGTSRGVRPRKAQDRGSGHRIGHKSCWTASDLGEPTERQTSSFNIKTGPPRTHSYPRGGCPSEFMSPSDTITERLLACGRAVRSPACGVVNVWGWCRHRIGCSKPPPIAAAHGHDRRRVAWGI